MKNNTELRATLNSVLARIGVTDDDGTLPASEWKAIAADLADASAYAAKTLRMWDAARAYRARLAESRPSGTEADAELQALIDQAKAP